MVGSWSCHYWVAVNVSSYFSLGWVKVIQGQGHSRSRSSMVKVKVIKGHSQDKVEPKSFKVKVIQSPGHQRSCKVRFINGHQRSMVGHGWIMVMSLLGCGQCQLILQFRLSQGHPRSRSFKVKIIHGQGQFHPRLRSSKVKVMTSKVKVSIGQGHPMSKSSRSSTVKIVVIKVQGYPRSRSS